MLPELHQTLQELIYREGRIERSEVDVAFEAPTKEFIDKLVRPTIDLYLIDLQENTELRHTHYQTTQSNGIATLQTPPRRIDAHYLVTTLTKNPDDALRLLWRVLNVLMRNTELAVDALPQHLRLELPIPSRVALPDSDLKLLDVWSAVGSEPRTSFGYVVTLPMELGLKHDAPLVLSRTVRYDSSVGAGGPEARSFVTGTVRDATHSPLADVTVMLVGERTGWTRTNAEGEFILRAPLAGHAALHVLALNGTTHVKELDLPASPVDFLLN